MSAGIKCKCQGTPEQKMENWAILTYRGNFSAFNGYKFAPSDYSCIQCKKCSSVWRTKASYVEQLRITKP